MDVYVLSDIMSYCKEKHLIRVRCLNKLFDSVYQKYSNINAKYFAKKIVKILNILGPVESMCDKWTEAKQV